MTFFSNPRCLPSALATALLCLALGTGSALGQQGLAIVDPLPGAYLSGLYEVVLRIDSPAQVQKTELFVDGLPVFVGEGWSARMSHDFGAAVDAHELFAQITTTDGQLIRSETISTRGLTIDYAETTRLILLSAMVKTRSNRPLLGLDKNDFRVFEDGQPLDIENFYRDQLPLDLVFLVDTSSSLRKEDAIAEVKQAALLFLNSLSPDDRVALYEFKTEPRKISHFTTDRKRLVEEIQAFTALGETALYDALNLALGDLGTKRKRRKALVLFTDGRDSVYRSPTTKARLFREAVIRAQNGETTIFAIGLGSKVHRDALTKMAEETGGRFYYADRGNRLRQVFEEMVLDLKTQYNLAVTPRSSTSGFHSIEVTVKKRNALVYARKGYTIE